MEWSQSENNAWENDIGESKLNSTDSMAGTEMMICRLLEDRDERHRQAHFYTNKNSISHQQSVQKRHISTMIFYYFLKRTNKYQNL